jgi:hypothetical protein
LDDIPQVLFPYVKMSVGHINKRSEKYFKPELISQSFKSIVHTPLLPNDKSNRSFDSIDFQRAMHVSNFVVTLCGWFCVCSRLVFQLL